MTIYLVRHGQDDSTVRGGWSSSPLTDEGAEQARMLADMITRRKDELDIRRILSSDLPRALQTAQPTADMLGLNTELQPQFREVNNGELAGMKNDLALVRYPGLFWNTLGWNEEYPGGESPKKFFERIKGAWRHLTEEIKTQAGNTMLVTHSGVIHIIRHLILGIAYSNAERQPPVPYATLIPVHFEDEAWRID